MTVAPRDRPAAGPGRAGRAARRVGGALAVLLGVVLGVAGALLLVPASRSDVGPFVVDVRVRPAVHGDVVLDVPPLGALRVDSHDGPLGVEARVVRLDPDEVRAVAADPERLRELGDALADDLRAAVRDAVLRGVLAGLLGGAVGATLVLRRPRAPLVGAGLAVVVLAAGGGAAAATGREDALAEPRYDGLLASAPQVVGGVQGLVDRFDDYNAQLLGLVSNVVDLYDVGSTLPVLPVDADVVRVLVVADLHLNPAGVRLTRDLVRSYEVDLVLDAGDLTDWGSTTETRGLTVLGRLGVPYVFVRGNHDSLAVQRQMAAQPDAVALDGDVVEVAGLRVLGDGDPRFTPDAATRGTPEQERDAVVQQGRRLAERAGETDPDVVLVHDPVAGEVVVEAGTVPLVLAGHVHERRRVDGDGSVMLVEGSTGGAGLRGLQGDGPTPMTASVLYLDRSSGELLAVDQLTLGGLGEASVSLERLVLADVERDDDSSDDEGSDGDGSDDDRSATGRSDGDGSEGDGSADGGG